MRLANRKLLLAENHRRKIFFITVNRSKAGVPVIKDSKYYSRGIFRDTVWLAERGSGKAVSIPLPSPLTALSHP